MAIINDLHDEGSTVAAFARGVWARIRQPSSMAGGGLIVLASLCPRPESLLVGLAGFLAIVISERGGA